MTAPDIILRLVDRFDSTRSQLVSASYNETQIRREFIDPFFGALGWDIDNRQGVAEAYKDVIHEDAIRIGSATKAPDYAFRIGGARKFFVEAKKPAVNIKEDIAPAFQLRRYAWSAKLPVSILTDFDELAVYDCRIKPSKTDKSSTARIKYLTYKDYISQWEDIYSIFSRDAVWKGSFDKYVVGTKGKKGTDEVDDAFLKEIESWRDVLARNVALRNPKLSVHELNFAVQRTIDRIIFLRICEDRGIETYGALQGLVNGERIYKRLCELFHRADEKYNSGLFHFAEERGRPETPDTFTLDLKVDDKPLKEILGGLYYPDCPYEFSILPADILGQVYEQFLGKVIRLTAGHQAKVEEKPEVKKAGGVYYTPTYIVDYIVKNTVGKLVEGKTPKQVESLRILDPACGSGSFLIGAYQYLLDWHHEWYTKDSTDKWSTGKNATLYAGPGGAWRMTTAERKRILLNNVYGVDIDSQAVEVTKLSLLLKVLEGENEETINQQLKMFHERALPDLGSNIKCGNSLIGPDFFEGQLIVDQEERNRINAFDWKSEFKETMDAGGFDAVIGNPPYVRQETLGQEFKDYSQQHYLAYASTADLYVYFIEKSHQTLRPEGFFGFICSNKYLQSNYGQPLRGFLTSSSSIQQIVDFGELPVFKNAATFPSILITRKGVKPAGKIEYIKVRGLEFVSLDQVVADTFVILDERAISGPTWTMVANVEQDLLRKIALAGAPLGEYLNCNIYYGIKTGLNEAFVISRAVRDAIVKRAPQSIELIKPYAVGDDIRKYHIVSKERYLIVIPKGWTDDHRGKVDAWKWLQKEHKAIADHLEPFAKPATARQDKGDYWWELRACDYYSAMEGPKIVYPDIAKESRAAFDRGGMFVTNTIYFIPSSDYYLLGILNSRLIFQYFKRSATVLGDADRGGRLRWFTQDVLKLPIRKVDHSDEEGTHLRQRLIDEVESILRSYAELPKAKTDQEKTALQRQIDATDKQIDAIVYELYGLTDEEIRIVEGQ